MIWKQERPYNNDSTASRLLSEVKHCLAWLVLRWGTTLESQVLFFYLNPCSTSHARTCTMMILLPCTNKQGHFANILDKSYAQTCDLMILLPYFHLGCAKYFFQCPNFRPLHLSDKTGAVARAFFDLALCSPSFAS